MPSPTGPTQRPDPHDAVGDANASSGVRQVGPHGAPYPDPNGNPYASNAAPNPYPGPNGNPYAAGSGGPYPDPHANPYASGQVPPGGHGSSPAFGGPGPIGGPIARPTWFSGAVAAEAGVQAAIVFGALIAGGTVLALAVGLVTSSLVDGLSLVAGGNAIPTVIQLTGLLLSGALVLSTGLASPGVSVTGTISVLPLLLTALVLATAVVAAVRAERRAPLPTFGTRVLVSVVTGAAVSLVLMVLTLVLPFSLASQGLGLEVTARSFTTVLFGTVLVGGASLLGRLAAATGPAPAFVAPLVLLRRAPRWLQETLTYAGIGTAVTTVAALVLAIMQIVDSPDSAGAVFGLFPLLLNVVILLAGLAHLGGVTAGAAVEASGYGASTGGAPMTMTVFSAGSPSALLLILVALLTTAVAAVRIGAARGRPAGFDARSFWRFPLAVLVGWLFVGVLLASVSMTFQGTAFIASASSEVTFGVTLWTPFVMLLWALAIEFAAPHAPIVAYTISPRLFALLAGKAAAKAWLDGPAAYLGGAASFAPGTDGGRYVPGSAPTGWGPNASGAWHAGSDGRPVPQPITSAPYGAAPTADAPPALSARARTRVLVGGIVAGALVVALIAGSIVVAAVNGGNSPEAAAREYLEAIASGDAERASELVDPNIPTGDRALLTNATMSGATERITDLTVSATPDTSVESDTRHVAVSYRLGGMEQTATLEVRRGENTALVFENWDVVTPLVVPIEVVSPQPTTVSVGGGTVDIEAGTTDWDGEVSATGTPNVHVYPGTYPVTGTGSEFFTYAAESVQATAPSVGYGSRDASVVLTPDPTEALQVAVQDAVNAALDECGASTEASPDGCPFSASIWSSNPVTWTITQHPTVRVENSSSFTAEDFSYSYSFTSTGSRTPKTGDETEDFSGRFEVVDGKVVVELTRS